MSVRIILYQEAGGNCPVVEFLRAQPIRVRLQAIKRVDLLSQHGHELRRPHADYMEDEIYELRWRSGKVQYRILYFFHGRTAVVLAHALTKEAKLPRSDLDRAKKRKENFYANPNNHTYPGGLHA